MNTLIDALDPRGDLIEQLAYWQGIRDTYRDWQTMTGLWMYHVASECVAELNAALAGEPETAA